MRTSSAELPRPSDYQTWTKSPGTALQAFATDADAGLDTNEVLRRRALFGHNRLRESRPRHLLAILAAQFKSVVIAVLAAAGGLAFLFSETVEGVAIIAVIAINSAIGFVIEWRAVRSMEALRQMALIFCVAIRNGAHTPLAAEELVPGDIVVLDAGDIVPADLRLIETAKLQADESTLTGESLPITKSVDPLAATTPMADRRNMAYRGTAITRGVGKGVVVAIGADTEFGQIFHQISSAEPSHTPLEKRLNALAERLVWVVGIIAAVVAGAGMLAGRDTFLAIEVAIALAVAAIPEGLPIVATIALARGMWRLAKRRALITRLSAVETLGATSVILTDKTGTLTENRMSVTVVQLAEAVVRLERSDNAEGAIFRIGTGTPDVGAEADLDELLTTGALCSNASLQRAADGAIEATGDPTELALLVAASGRDIWRDALLQKFPEIREEAFDPDAKRMATLHTDGSRVRAAVKGAPEQILPSCTSVRRRSRDVTLDAATRQQWIERADQLGRKGLRTLALATKTMPGDAGDPFTDLVLLGFVGLEDPPRVGVAEAIARCREAGVSVIMVTGDHAATARSIAEELGIAEEPADAKQFVEGAELGDLIEVADNTRLGDARVFSRVTPAQKLRLIDWYQRQGCIVAMTGDGVNDAPALKKADIGVAMGIRGTEVAKEAAAMVLQDDEFNTIAAAIEHGRAIFSNIRKFVIYLLSCNISEVMIVSLATIAGAPLPILPLQILFLNLVTDVFPALALGVGPGAASLMTRQPRAPNEKLITRTHWLRILLHGAVLSASVLGAMSYAIVVLDFQASRAVTVSFCTLALAQMWHVLNVRDSMHHWISNEVTRNGWIWIALAICLALVLSAVYLPGLAAVLALHNPGIAGWAVIVAASIVPVLVGPLVRRAVPLRSPE